MRFQAKVELGGKTATGIEVPVEIVEGLGAGKRPAVRVTINGFTFRTTVAPMGGKFYIPVSAERREGAGIAAGDDVDVDMELDTEPRVLTLPPDFADALVADPRAKEFFDRLSYSHKLRHVQSIQAAKKPETRRRRIEKSISMLREGKAR